MGKKASVVPRPEYNLKDFVMYKGEAGDLRIGEVEAITVFITDRKTEIQYGFKGGADTLQANITGKVTVHKKRAPRGPNKKKAEAAQAVVQSQEALAETAPSH